MRGQCRICKILILDSDIFCQDHLSDEIRNIEEEFIIKYPKLTDLKVSYRQPIYTNECPSYEIIAKRNLKDEKYIATEYTVIPISEFIFPIFIFMMFYIMLVGLITLKSFAEIEETVKYYYNQYMYPHNIDEYYYEFEEI